MAKKASKRKKRKTVRTKTQTKKRVNRPAKVFIYALALAALSGGGFLLYSQMRRKKFATQTLPSENTDTIIINNNLPPSYSTSSSAASKTSSTKANDNFPLKNGSRGPRVTTLQQALAKIIGTVAMNANGGIDGIFGNGTAAALKAAGYPDVIDEPTYKKITGSSDSEVKVVFNPSAIALSLYRAAQIKNAEAVLTALKQIKSVSEYSSVNDYYKRQAFIISKTIVTDLLDYAFVNNEGAKTLIRNEFLRIGLKVDDLGKWSLQGFKLFKDLITLRETIVIDANNNHIPVRKNTILGDEVKIANGMSWFRSIDNSILSVPTQDVKYT